MLWRRVSFPDFCEPCLPSPAEKPPAGTGWVHGGRAALHSQRARLDRTLPANCRGRSLTQGRVACDDDGLPVFDRLRGRRDDLRVFLYAFDLMEINGDDLRGEAIETRKAALARLLRNVERGLLLNEHIMEPGDVVFRHACKLGLEGIVSKKLGSSYRSGRSRYWVKSKNQQHPAVKREAEEDWGRERWHLGTRPNGTA
jgi:bifunctional non-homologous end joining protein LigD